MKILDKFSGLNDTQRHFVIKWFTIIFLLIFVCVGMIISHIHRVNSLNYANYTEKVQDIASNSKYKSEQNVRKKIIQDSVHSNDPILKSLGQNRVMNDISIPTLKNFFNAYYNWDNVQKYDKRTNSVKNFVTPNVLKNKQLFKNNNKYVTTNNREEILNNISESIINNHGNNLNLLLDCNFTTWTNNGNANSSDNNDDRHNEAQWWTITYNTHTHKITSTIIIFGNPKANNGNGDGATNANTATESNQAGDNVPY